MHFLPVLDLVTIMLVFSYIYLLIQINFIAEFT